jgi:hypothetical protein
MTPERTIRESDLAELIGMALQLQESATAVEEHRLSDREVLQIGENIGIPGQVMDRALRSYRDLRRDLFRSALGPYVRDELLRKMQDVKLRDLYAQTIETRRRVRQREELVRRSRRDLGLLELLNPFSSSPSRSAFEQEKESLRNEQRSQEHFERRLYERIEEILDGVAPLSVVLRAERVEQVLEGLGALRYAGPGEAVAEAVAHLHAMRKAVTDAFGVIPRRAELVRMVADALPEFFEDLHRNGDEDLA